MFGKTDVYKNRFPLLPKGFKIARSRTRVNWKNRRFMIPRNAPNEADRVALAHYIHKYIILFVYNFRAGMGWDTCQN